MGPQASASSGPPRSTTGATPPLGPCLWQDVRMLVAYLPLGFPDYRLPSAVLEFCLAMYAPHVCMGGAVMD